MEMAGALVYVGQREDVAGGDIGDLNTLQKSLEAVLETRDSDLFRGLGVFKLET